VSGVWCGVCVSVCRKHAHNFPVVDLVAEVLAVERLTERVECKFDVGDDHIARPQGDRLSVMSHTHNTHTHIYIRSHTPHTYTHTHTHTRTHTHTKYVPPGAAPPFSAAALEGARARAGADRPSHTPSRDRQAATQQSIRETSEGRRK